MAQDNKTKPAIITAEPVHGSHARKPYADSEYISVPIDLLIEIQDKGDVHSNALATKAIQIGRRLKEERNAES